jgi:hypothetical protein
MKRFIFLIETIEQCMALWFRAPELGSAYWAFCDNVGARFSRRKGTRRTTQRTPWFPSFGMRRLR